MVIYDTFLIVWCIHLQMVFNCQFFTFIDTLVMAKNLHPGKRNSLDVLCDRYFVDNSSRTLHGALLDANLLADVYLAMTRGQESLLIDGVAEDVDREADIDSLSGEIEYFFVEATESENVNHLRHLEEIDKECQLESVWSGLIKKANKV